MSKLNLTKRTLDTLALPDKGQRLTLNDSKVSGLVLRVTDKGRKTFVVYKKLNGSPIRVTLGTYPELSIENARKKAVQVIAEFMDGKNPNVEKQKIRHDLAIKQAFEEYLEKHAKKHKKTWKYDEQQFNRYLTNWHNKKLSAVTRQDIENLHKKIGDAHGIYAANRLLAFLKTLYNKAIQWGWKGTNPAYGVKKYKEKSRDRFLQPKELPEFFKALNAENNKTVRDYILLSLLTGARKSNVLSMRFEEIDFDRGVWRIPETKNGEALDIPLVVEALNLLKNRKVDINSEWVFPSATSESGHLEDPKKVWRRILESAGISNMRIHDIRRTLGSYQAISGASEIIIGKSLGHKSRQATQVYSRLNDDPVRLSMEKAMKTIQSFANEKDSKTS